MVKLSIELPAQDTVDVEEADGDLDYGPERGIGERRRFKRVLSRKWRADSACTTPQVSFRKS